MAAVPCVPRERVGGVALIDSHESPSHHHFRLKLQEIQLSCTIAYWYQYCTGQE